MQLTLYSEGSLFGGCGEDNLAKQRSNHRNNAGGQEYRDGQPLAGATVVVLVCRCGGARAVYTSASFSGQSDFASQKSCVYAVTPATKSACPTAAKKRLLPHSAAPQSTPPTPFPRQPESKV